MSSAKSTNKRQPDPEVLASAMRAVAHPVRIATLLALTDGELSPIELSRRQDPPLWSLGTIAYHVRKLASMGLIELSGTIQRRGAIEHRYAASRDGRRLAAAIRALPVPQGAKRQGSRAGRSADAS
jgi:DNA-binding PadR family transcriptional regulator